MKNWRTTLIGAIGAGLVAGYGAFSAGGLTIDQIIIAGFMAFIGVFSKDFNVSGK